MNNTIFVYDMKFIILHYPTMSMTESIHIKVLKSRYKYQHIGSTEKIEL